MTPLPEQRGRLLPKSAADSPLRLRVDAHDDALGVALGRVGVLVEGLRRFHLLAGDRQHERALVVGISEEVEILEGHRDGLGANAEEAAEIDDDGVDRAVPAR